LYLVANYFPDLLPKLESTLESVVAAINNNGINTILSSYNILALSSYDESVHGNAPNNLHLIGKDANNQVL
jgi:hypothetical protein